MKWTIAKFSSNKNFDIFNSFLPLQVVAWKIKDTSRFYAKHGDLFFYKAFQPAVASDASNANQQCV